MNHTILLISCPDRRGITAAVTQFVFQHNGNIIHADQHIDEQSNTFFMRVEWSLEGFNLRREEIAMHFGTIATQFQMHWTLHFADVLPRVALFVSKPLHCLQDLLLRYREGQLRCHIPLIISNHEDARPVAEEFKCKFHYFSIDPQNKLQQESREIELLAREQINVIVLARYHQILSAPFVEKFPRKIINIHHSFLPAFVGSNPYAQAYQKGVKIIGATSHYVVDKLDEGPIIEQDTVRVSHRDALEDLIQKGQDLEKVVLYRAVRWHLERKVLTYGNKTVVFD